MPYQFQEDSPRVFKKKAKKDKKHKKVKKERKSERKEKDKKKKKRRHSRSASPKKRRSTSRGSKKRRNRSASPKPLPMMPIATPVGIVPPPPPPPPMVPNPRTFTPQTNAGSAGLRKFLSQHAADPTFQNTVEVRTKPQHAAVYAVQNGKLTNILASGNDEQYLAAFQRTWENTVHVERALQIMIALSGVKQSDTMIQTYCGWLDKKVNYLIQTNQILPSQVVTTEGSHFFYDTIVDFSNNQMGDFAFQALVDVLIKYRLRPLKMMLYKNQLTDHSIGSLQNLLVSLSPAAVPELHLSHNRITADGCVSLIMVFKTLKQYPYRAPSGLLVPVWVRVENNPIPEHRQVLQTIEQLDIVACLAEERTACGVGKCKCSDPLRCSTVPLVHLPMFHMFPEITVQNQSDRICSLLQTAVVAAQAIESLQRARTQQLLAQKPATPSPPIDPALIQCYSPSYGARI